MEGTIYFDRDASQPQDITEPEQIVAIIALAAAMAQKEEE